MKIVVIGGSGLIGKKLVTILKSLGHEVTPASPSSGVDATTGKGLKEAISGAKVVVDVANSPSFDENSALEFFEKACYNLFKEEKAAGVGHHVALSVVGTEKLAKSGYFRAKNAQEHLIKASGLPYTIVQSTQFYEFLSSIAKSATEGQTVRLPQVAFQPIAAEDVAMILADIAVKPPLNHTVEIAGPKRAGFPEIVQEYLTAIQDGRKAVSDPKASYFGVTVMEDSLVPGKNPRIGPMTLENWLRVK
jgi:uncharacterized protein YbjT (DUF2867 family)